MKNIYPKITAFALFIFTITAHAQATFNLAAGTGTGAGWTWNDPVLTINDGANITITGQVKETRKQKSIFVKKLFVLQKKDIFLQKFNLMPWHIFLTPSMI